MSEDLMAQTMSRYAALGWDRDQLDAHRIARLRALLVRAKQDSPFYARRLARLDVASATPQHLADVEPTTKKDLAEHFDEIVTVPGLTRERAERHVASLVDEPTLLDGCYVLATSGSTGQRTLSVFDRSELIWNLAGLARWRIRWMARGEVLPAEGGILVFGGASPAHMSAATTHEQKAAMANAPEIADMPEITVIPAATPFPEIRRRVCELKPAALSGFPSILVRLAAAQNRGDLDIQPLGITYAGETLSEQGAETIRRAWGVQARGLYGSSELSFCATSDTAGGPMIGSDDEFIFEPVDAGGSPADPETESAKLFVTTLDRRAMPLIRYEMPDRVIWRPADGSSDVPFSSFEKILGRSDDWFRYGEVAVHPSTFSSVLAEVASVEEYQVRQTAKGAEILILAAAGVDFAPTAERVAKALERHGVDDPDVQIVPVKAIVRPGSGQKLRAFIPLGA